MNLSTTWDIIRDYVSLTKPGIVVMLLVTAYCAMVVAAGGLPSATLTIETLLGLGLSAGGAHAVNMWYDQDIDRLMKRTEQRPVAVGRIPAQNAAIFGVIAEVVSLIGLGLLVDWLAALASLAGFLFYVFVYTMWLKRRTPQNIVIGGAAGAFPPLVGWAAVTNHIGIAAVLMFLIIFLWTPPHFWALALYKQDDYRQAGIPMMPVVKGEQSTKVQSLLYSILLLIASILLYLTHVVGGVYLVLAVLLGLGFIFCNIVLFKEQAPAVRWAKGSFRYSLFYMTGIFVAMVINVH